MGNVGSIALKGMDTNEMPSSHPCNRTEYCVKYDKTEESVGDVECLTLTV